MAIEQLHGTELPRLNRVQELQRSYRKGFRSGVAAVLLSLLTGTGTAYLANTYSGKAQKTAVSPDRNTVPVPAQKSKPAPQGTGRHRSTNKSTVQLKTLDQARHGGISAKRWQEMYDATMRVVVDTVESNGKKQSWFCTGTFVNEAVLTAGHCLRTRPGEKVERVEMYQGSVDKTDPVMEGVAWDISPDHDIAAIKVNILKDQVSTLYVPIFNGSVAAPGEQYFTDGLPGDSTAPVSGSLSFLFRDGISDQLIVNDSDNYSVCQPGASGSLMAAAGDRYGLLTGVSLRKSHTVQEWQSQMKNEQTESRIVLDPKKINEQCGIDYLSGDLVENLYAPLRG